MSKKVRVRFAPSPTGGLHLGGVRTVLFNYLFAKHHNGAFIVRIEDTDQSRFVAGAEQYIFDTLQWCGLTPDESPSHGGPFAPYRQSERKANYKKYAAQLIDAGVAYYAFDTPEELDIKRKQVPNFQYSGHNRMEMRNSISMSKEEVATLLQNGTPYVIRIKIPANETLSLHDLIRGDIHFDTNIVDDKVLLKADGMPTYHLAVVVDDYLMEITHAFRGEEWLPSAPVHVLLWKHLFGLDKMPLWAHLPLILKPDGNGKLSKRDGERLGFPVFAMDWTDPNTNEKTIGFKERGFVPEAFINLLALLGWNNGTDQEIFTKEELIAQFSLERVHKGGAKFDYEKAKWFNHEWIKKLPNETLLQRIKPLFEKANFKITDEAFLLNIINMVKERCHFLTDFIDQSKFFFESPMQYDIQPIKAKWDDQKLSFFNEFVKLLERKKEVSAPELENEFKALATQLEIKPGDLMLPFRIMLVGGKFGPGVFDIAVAIGLQDSIKRIQYCLSQL